MYLTLMALLTLSACTQLPESKPTVDGIKVSRKDYVEQEIQTEEKDISSVVQFVEELNAQLEPKDRLEDYTTSYDKETDTVFLEAGQSTMAFKLGSEGEILFASCNGSPSVKSVMSRGIAKVMMGGSSEVEGLFQKAEESRWLNAINSKALSSSADAFLLDDLDTSLPDSTPPELPKLDSELTMPTITEKLEDAGLMDLSEYFESPTLEKFWDGIDVNDIQSEMADTKNRGNDFQNIELPDVSSSTS